LWTLRDVSRQCILKAAYYEIRKKMKTYKFRVVIEQDEDGIYVVSVPALRGCYSQGDTVDEALENVKDAIRLHIEARKAAGEPIPIEVLVDEVEVSV